jgi:hypothetical protein
VLELGREGKFSAKATGWDENKVIKPGEKIEISLADGHWRIVKVPAPARSRPIPTRMPSSSTSCDSVTLGVTV